LVDVHALGERAAVGMAQLGGDDAGRDFDALAVAELDIAPIGTPTTTSRLTTAASIRG
jgi:hypothetical protein